MDKASLFLIFGAGILFFYVLFNMSGSSGSGAPGTPSSGPSWPTSVKTAQAQSLTSTKPILVNFTGSDWCGWCVKLKKEVFNTTEFEQWAAQNVVLLEVDFPRNTKLPPEIKAQNEKLQKRYNIKGFPTILFLNADGEEIGRMGYLRGGPEAWTTAANKLLTKMSGK